MPFVIVDDHTPHQLGLDGLDLQRRITPPGQLDLFSLQRSALTGDV